MRQHVYRVAVPTWYGRPRNLACGMEQSRRSSIGKTQNEPAYHRENRHDPVTLNLLEVDRCNRGDDNYSGWQSVVPLSREPRWIRVRAERSPQARGQHSTPFANSRCGAISHPPDRFQPPMQRRPPLDIPPHSKKSLRRWE